MEQNVKCMLKDNLPKTIDCPSCDKISFLVEENRVFVKNHISVNGNLYPIHINALIYRCECGESFTTTESDTITLKRVDSKFNSIKRIIKIKNILVYPIFGIPLEKIKLSIKKS